MDPKLENQENSDNDKHITENLILHSGKKHFCCTESVKAFMNVLVMGLSGLCCVGAFFASAMALPATIKGLKVDYDDYNINQFIVLIILNGSASLFCWTVPSFIGLLTLKYTLILGAISMTIYIVSIMSPYSWTLYLTPLFGGLGGAILMAGSGACVTQNSTKNNVSRNSGLIWCLFKSGVIVGNIFVNWQFGGMLVITHHVRITTISVLGGMSLTGVLLLGFLQESPYQQKENFNSPSSQKKANKSPIKTFLKAVRMFTTRKTLLLSPTFVYCGLSMTFYSSVFVASVGFTKQFGKDAKALIGSAGMLTGLGEAAAGFMMMVIGKRIECIGRDTVMVLGFLCHCTMFYLTFLGLPDNAPFGETDEATYIVPNKIIVLLSGFLLGFGYGLVIVLSYSIIGALYPNSSETAHSIYRSLQTLACAIGFAYSSQLTLKWQLIIMTIANVVSVICYNFVEWEHHRTQKVLNQNSMESSLQTSEKLLKMDKC